MFLGIISGFMYMRIDHIYRSITAFIGLLIPEFFQRKVNSPEKLRPFLKPLYNDSTMAILGIFIAIHVSLVNVPFTTIDLFHREWTDADMISHFLGGLTVWLILAEILNEFSKVYGCTQRQVIIYAFALLFILSIGWEAAEKLSESGISFIKESIGNKFRDLIMNTLGALLGCFLVIRRGLPFELTTKISYNH